MRREVETTLAELPGRVLPIVVEGAVTRRRLDRAADTISHRPDWRNVWGRVHVCQRTQDAGHVLTGTNFRMAASVNRAAAQCAARRKSPWPGGPGT